MTEHPIPFTGPMVRAILAGTKTVTRRPVRRPKAVGPVAFEDAMQWAQRHGKAGVMHRGPCDGIDWVVKCPYGSPGDTLWVRENWRPRIVHTCGQDACDCADVSVTYPADGVEVFFRDESVPDGWRMPKSARRSICPSIHMPRWAARILLEVTAVRVERVQEITEEQATAEGCSPVPFCRAGVPAGNEHVEGFSESWDAMYGKGLYAWEKNPWVWVVSFRRIEG